MSSVAFCPARRWTRRIDSICTAAAGRLIFGAIICPSGQVCLQVQREIFFPSRVGNLPANRTRMFGLQLRQCICITKKKKKSTISLRVGGGEEREENTLVCSSSRPHSLWLHIDVFQMISRTRSSGHGWKTNSYFLGVCPRTWRCRFSGQDSRLFFFSFFSSCNISLHCLSPDRPLLFCRRGISN